MECNHRETEKAKEYSSEDSFWEYYQKWGYVQAAAFAAAVITGDGRNHLSIKRLLLHVGRFCELYREADQPFLTKALIRQAPKLSL